MKVEVIKEVNINLQGKEVDILWDILKTHSEDYKTYNSEIETVLDTLITILQPLVQNPR